MEKYLVVAYFDDKSYADRGIVLVRDSKKKPRDKEILAIGPWCGEGYIVENWPAECYKDIKDGKRLDLDDSLWDAVVRYKTAKEGDSKKEEQTAKDALEKIIGSELVVEMHLAGVQMDSGNTNFEIGDELEIEITGGVGRLTAEVITFDNCSPPHPILKADGWPVLKDGDYIIKMKIVK